MCHMYTYTSTLYIMYTAILILRGEPLSYTKGKNRRKVHMPMTNGTQVTIGDWVAGRKLSTVPETCAPSSKPLEG